MNSPHATQNTELKNDTFGLGSRLAERERFLKLQEAMWLTIINEIFKFPQCQKMTKFYRN